MSTIQYSYILLILEGCKALDYVIISHLYITCSYPGIYDGKQIFNQCVALHSITGIMRILYSAPHGLPLVCVVLEI